MYATCLFCNSDLGRNETLETFPVGRRLAFDPARGRLWVVCRKCERWNLSPLEERWEAIETADRLYTDTRRRVSTDEIGLARMRDGLELVRIGKPLRREFAAWRYGDQFGRRRRRQLIIAGAGVAAVSALVIGGATAGVGIGGFGWMIAQAGKALVHGRADTVVAKIRTDAGETLHVRRRHLSETALMSDADGGLAIDLRFKNGHRAFFGREAQRIAATVIPTVNRFGGSRTAVADAVNAIDEVGSPEGFLETLARGASGNTRVEYMVRGQPVIRWARRRADYTNGLFALPSTDRLALEMALHEESERRAMSGELAELERAWRTAEEIAGISDDLLVSPSVQSSFEAMRNARGDDPRRLIDDQS